MFSAELPWRDNLQGKSCIPEGKYRVVWGLSPRLKKFTYRILDVPARSGVLIHSANLMGNVDAGFKCQLEGCIALGERRGVMEGQKAILLSKPAIRRFEDKMERKEFTLEIVNEWGDK